jgi:hypothetical protein
MIFDTITLWLPKGSVDLNRKGLYTIKTLNCIPQSYPSKAGMSDKKILKGVKNGRN